MVLMLKKMDLVFPLTVDDSKLMLRLPHSRPQGIDDTLAHFRRDNHPSLMGSWKLFLGAPPGVIEKMLTKCCSLGDTNMF